MYYFAKADGVVKTINSCHLNILEIHIEELIEDPCQRRWFNVFRELECSKEYLLARVGEVPFLQKIFFQLKIIQNFHVDCIPISYTALHIYIFFCATLVYNFEFWRIVVWSESWSTCSDTNRINWENRSSFSVLLHASWLEHTLCSNVYHKTAHYIITARGFEDGVLHAATKHRKKEFYYYRNWYINVVKAWPLHFLFCYHNINSFPPMKMKFKTIAYRVSWKALSILGNKNLSTRSQHSTSLCHEFSFYHTFVATNFYS